MQAQEGQHLYQDKKNVKFSNNYSHVYIKIRVGRGMLNKKYLIFSGWFSLFVKKKNQW